MPLVGSLRAVGICGGQFNAQFGKQPAAVKYVGPIQENMVEARKDQRLASAAIDWLPSSSTHKDKRDAAQKAIDAGRLAEKETAAQQGRQRLLEAMGASQAEAAKPTSAV